MKKITAVILFFGCLSISKAQTTSDSVKQMRSSNDRERPDFNAYQPKKYFSEIEIMLGPSLSFLRGSPYVENNSVITRSLKHGYAYGIAFNHSLKTNFCFYAAFMFEKKGSISSANGSYFDQVSQTMKSITIKDEFIYDYFTMPILIGYSLGHRKRIKVKTGVFVSYLRKQIIEKTYIPLGPGGIEDQTDLNTKFDFGLDLEFGYSIPISSTISTNVKLINTLGLINTRAADNYGVIKTNNTSLLIGIIFNRK